MKRLLPLLCLVAGLSQPAFAGNLSALSSLTQAEFRQMSEDFGGAFSYKPLSPTIALGVTGFDVGVELTSSDVSKSARALSKAGATSSTTMDTLLVPKLHLHKGLPLGLDISAFVANLSAIDAQLVGGELRYALIDGGVASPAVGVRGAFTNLNGSNQLGFNTRSVDISVSKGFAILTPYIGIGQVWVNSTPNVAGLSNENFTQGKVFAGINFNMGLVNFVVETDKTGDTTTWGLKMGVRW